MDGGGSEKGIEGIGVIFFLTSEIQISPSKKKEHVLLLLGFDIWVLDVHFQSMENYRSKRETKSTF